MGCQMTSADEVSRPPVLGHGSGGAGGRDVALPDETAPDSPAAGQNDARSLDGQTAEYDTAIDPGGARLDSALGGQQACKSDPACNDVR